VIDALRVWLLLELIGLGGAAVAGVVLGRMPGAGLGFGKVLGLLLVTWLVWIGGTSTLVPYGTVSAALWIALVCSVGLLAAVRRAAGVRAAARERPRGLLARRRWRILAARVPAESDPLRRPLFLAAEAVFLVAFVAATLLVAWSPDVWGTETPMDMAFLAAVNRADTFPPADPWLAGADLNYYYLGHLAMAVPVKLSGVAPDRGYNLAVAAVLALGASAVFTLAGSLWATARGARGAVAAGVGAVGLVVVLGNMEGARLLLAHGGPLVDYPWFDASRVVPDTINEFPWFSFLVGDLHAHVVALPFAALALAFALQVALLGPRRRPRRRAGAEVLVASLALGMLYAINTWSYPVLAGLLVLAVAAWVRDPRSAPRRVEAARWLLAVLALSVLLVLPFHLGFDPAARGVGAVTERRSFAEWLADLALVLGSLLPLVALAFAGLLLGTRRPGRNAAWGAAAAVFAGSLLAAIGRLHVVVLALALAVALRGLLAVRREPAQRAVWLVLAGGIACVAVPEVLYVRDEFDGSGLYRMNTVFKLGIQAWLLLGVGGVVALAWRQAWLRRRAARVAAGAALAAVLVAAAAYPVAGTYASRGGFGRAATLDGLGWLRERAPGDVLAIDWLNEHAPAGAVVLEAVGDDYSAFGHARISTFTGLPTVLGWPGHERQWGHDPGTRARDVERMYRGGAAEAEPLLRRYGVRYVVVGPLERTDYGDEGIAKWDGLGRRVLHAKGTTVWDLGSPPGGRLDLAVEDLALVVCGTVTPSARTARSRRPSSPGPAAAPCPPRTRAAGASRTR
jgi:YYY domain-containing protein